MTPIIVLTGQSNMVRSAPHIAALLPDYTVINCAVGGTSVTPWQKGEAVYEKCVAKVLPEIRNGGQVAGILHFQGEADAQEYEVARRWHTLTQQFLLTLRADLDAPTALFVYGKLGKRPLAAGYPHWYIVNIKQEKLLADHPEYRMIYTSDLEPHCPPEGVHWCDDVYPVLAGRFVEAFLTR